MSRASQAHRQTITGFDSSGQPPAAGTNYLAPTQSLSIFTAAGTDVAKAIIIVTGNVFVGTQTLNVSLTPTPGSQAVLNVAAPVGNAFDAAVALATLIDGETEFTAVAVGARVEVLCVLPTTSFVIDEILFS